MFPFSPMCASGRPGSTGPCFSNLAELIQIRTPVLSGPNAMFFYDGRDDDNDDDKEKKRDRTSSETW